MDTFEQQLVQKIKPETLTLDRLINFYIFIENNNWSGSLLTYGGKKAAWINTHGQTNPKSVFEGQGDTLDEAMNDLLGELKKCGLY